MEDSILIHRLKEDLVICHKIIASVLATNYNIKTSTKNKLSNKEIGWNNCLKLIMSKIEMRNLDLMELHLKEKIIAKEDARII